MIGFFKEFQETVCAYVKYDPATKSRLEVCLLYPGIKAWVLHYAAHRLYKSKVPFFPRFLSELGRFVSGIDIHPGAQFGRRVIMDHGLGIVIGETAIIGDDVLIYQGVTLGGTSLERAKRHPTIGAKCVLGAGSKVLGNIEIGEGVRVGANSVVVKPVPPFSTVVGIPAKVVGVEGGVRAGEELEHGKLSDPLLVRLEELERKCKDLEAHVLKK